MSAITIQSINFGNNQITVLFEQHWFQEDIIKLRQLLLSNISNLYINEVVTGADLETVRFQWLDAQFILTFDYYSQSCWFDAQNDNSLPESRHLFNLLIQNSKKHV